MLTMSVTIASQVRAQLLARRELPPPERRRELRIRAGLPQSTTAKIVGVGRTAISMYESGLREPRPGTMHRERYLELLDALQEYESGLRDRESA